VLNRFQGEAGKRLRLQALASQKLVAGNHKLAEELDAKAQLMPVPKGQILIEQNESDNDVYLILAGAFDISVNGRIIRRRVPNDHVGEMAAIEPTQRRAATVVATEDSLVAKLTESDFAELGGRYPEIYLYIARELARRLLQRNVLISQAREKIRVFIISSVESLGVARAIQNAFAHDPFLTVIWTDGVFRASNYTLQSLEDAVDNSDFAVAVAHADDITESKGKAWPAPRDNVIFELGLFMGRLGKARAILMEPRDEGVKLPSDMAGVTTIPYRYAKGSDAAALMGPACNNLREYILRLGPNN
jgi:CRP/FNR family cyclic AMP-dependent transcriptional regulator